MAYHEDETIINELTSEISKKLSSIGIIYRIFGRIKTKDSIIEKLSTKKDDYEKLGKKMQDLFGIRIAVYFSDDVDITEKVVNTVYDLHSISADQPSTAFSGAIRRNAIYKIPPRLVAESYLLKSNNLIDSTFEVQYRTILSEGWHEVEHDLRYKCKSDWIDHGDLSRSLNGIMATLETCDWTTIKLFDELAWRHYKARAWEQMVRHKFRLRFQPSKMNPKLLDALSTCDDVSRKIFKTDRCDFLNKLVDINIKLPITLDNTVYIINRLFIKHVQLKSIENEALSDLLDEWIPF